MISGYISDVFHVLVIIMIEHTVLNFWNKNIYHE